MVTVVAVAVWIVGALTPPVWRAAHDQFDLFHQIVKSAIVLHDLIKPIEVLHVVLST